MPTITDSDTFDGPTAPIVGHLSAGGRAWAQSVIGATRYILNGAGAVTRAVIAPQDCAIVLQGTDGYIDTSSTVYLSADITPPNTGSIFTLYNVGGANVEITWDGATWGWACNGSTGTLGACPTTVQAIVIGSGSASLTLALDGSTVYSGTRPTYVLCDAFSFEINKNVFTYSGTVEHFQLEGMQFIGTNPDSDLLAVVGRDQGGAQVRSGLTNAAGGTSIGGGVLAAFTARDFGGSEGRVAAVTSAAEVVLEVYFAGVQDQHPLSPVDYGLPTKFTLTNPVVGNEYILEKPAADLAGFLSGLMGNVKLRRAGPGGNYSGDIVCRAIELVYDEKVT